MDLNTLIIIDKIASLGTFSAAGKALKIPNSNLSLKVKQLEENLGQPLFTRSTRQVTITEFGRLVLKEARPLVEIKNRIEALADEEVDEPRGMIKVTAPYEVGLYLLRSIVPPFTQKYEKVQVEVDLNNDYLDIIAGGFDLAIRASMGKLADSSIIAVKLGEALLKLYAHRNSPFASIDDMKELQRAPILSMGRDVRINHLGEGCTLHHSSQITVNDMTGIKHATLGMAGIGVLPDFMCSDVYSKSALVNILPEANAGKGFFYGMYPQKSSLSPKNRRFIEFLKEHFKLSE